MEKLPIKKILKPTKLKIIITAFLIIMFMIIKRMIYSKESPNETLFFKIDQIIFSPVSFIHQTVKNICLLFSPEVFNQSSCLYVNSLPFIFTPFLFFAFILNIFIYYFLACILVYILICIKKSGLKNNPL